MSKKVQTKYFLIFIRVILIAISIFYFKGAESQMIKSHSDYRNYRNLTLDNGLKVMLVSDPKTEKVAVSLNVQVGSYEDPDGHLGLAHFLEHMLFLGTKKYPELGEYEKFIESHGGMWNAETWGYQTIYYFDIFSDYLEPALDRLSQFFISPLLTKKMIGKEKNAVDSEFQMGLKDDYRRLYNVDKYTSNPKHPYSRFSTGNLQTLSSVGDDVLSEQVVKLYNEKYSPSLMSLAVYGSQDLEQLESWVKEHFSPIAKKKPFTKNYIDIPLHTPKELNNIINVKAIGEKKELLMHFTIPEQVKYFKTKPAAYIANLLEQKGENGLYAYLLDKNWINSLHVGIEQLTKEQDLFDVIFDMTESGFEHVPDIIYHTFQYLQLIQKEGIEQWRFDELKSISDLMYKFKEKDQALSESYKLSIAVHNYPTEFLLSANDLFFNYSEKDIEHVMSYLIPDNLRVFLLARDVKTNQEEPYYKIPFKVEKFNNVLLTKWNNVAINPKLYLPKKNEFIEKDVKLIKSPPTEKTTPSLILDSENVKAWCYRDNKFDNPLVDIKYLVKIPNISNDLKSTMMVDLYLYLLSEELKIKLHPAIFAGNSFSISRDIYGIKVAISGYSWDKVQKISTIINEELLSFKMNGKRFNAIQDRTLRMYRDYMYKIPLRKQSSDLMAALHKSEWLVEDKIKMLGAISYRDVISCVKNITKNVQLEYFAYGQLNCKDVPLSLEGLSKTYNLQASDADIIKNRIVSIEPGQFIRSLTKTKHDDSSILWFYQPQDKTPQTFAKVLLLENILSEPFFTDIRTKKQFGYFVRLMSFKSFDTIGLGYMVQSPTKSVNQIFEGTEQFIKKIGYDALKTIKVSEFDVHKEAVKALLLKKPVNRDEEMNEFEREIFWQTYDFARKKKIAKEIDQINIKDLIAFYESFHFGANRKALLLHTKDPKASSIKAVEIKSLDDFKKKANYY